jgi:hypothetical protein
MKKISLGAAALCATAWLLKYSLSLLTTKNPLV